MTKRKHQKTHDTDIRRECDASDVEEILTDIAIVVALIAWCILVSDKIFNFL